jgi:hypothetical protein
VAVQDGGRAWTIEPTTAAVTMRGGDRRGRRDRVVAAGSIAPVDVHVDVWVEGKISVNVRPVAIEGVAGGRTQRRREPLLGARAVFDPKAGEPRILAPG